MKLTFIGKQTPMSAPQERKLEARIAKLSKLLDRKRQTPAVAVLSTERHLQKTEITIRYYDQALVGSGSNTDQFASLMDAVENLEVQIIRFRAKRRDLRRDTPQREARTSGIAVEPEIVVPAGKAAKPVKAPKSKPAKVVRADARGNGKPMTVEEAMLTMDAEQDYVVYRDAETGSVSVLVRRRDGKLDLIEA